MPERVQLAARHTTGQSVMPCRDERDHSLCTSPLSVMSQDAAHKRTGALSLRWRARDAGE
eukprot:2302470-Prymnesium_polylepis.1